jgi:hypothetical protein
VDPRHWARPVLYKVQLERTARVADHPGGDNRGWRGLRRVVRYLALGTAIFGAQVHGLHEAMAYLRAVPPR